MKVAIRNPKTGEFCSRAEMIANVESSHMPNGGNSIDIVCEQKKLQAMIDWRIKTARIFEAAGPLTDSIGFTGGTPRIEANSRVRCNHPTKRQPELRDLIEWWDSIIAAQRHYCATLVATEYETEE